jgi:phosphate transport system protein
MTFYEQRLSTDREEILRRVVNVGRQVSGAVSTAVEALLDRDEAACARVILGDLPINREVRAINRQCHRFIARHLPSGIHLRFVSAVLQMNVGLERIGDYAVTIAREGVQLSAAPTGALADELRALARQATTVLGHALDAFEGQDASLARHTKPEAKSVGRTFAQIYREFAQRGSDLPLTDALALLSVFHRLERVSDQAKNLCEDTLFELTGETKPPKRYEILFVDARGTIAAPLAAALGRKAFPESGNFSSAGYQAGDALAPELLTLASELSLDVSGPERLPSSVEELEKYHVIVGLNPGVRGQLKNLPYSTVFLQWDVPRLADAVTGADLHGKLRDLSRELSNQVLELMTTMRGDDAS